SHTPPVCVLRPCLCVFSSRLMLCFLSNGSLVGSSGSRGEGLLCEPFVTACLSGE
ncbi:hypothetical protein KUCAC02_010204, partial [Chaenocephalus aceratus]